MVEHLISRHFLSNVPFGSFWVVNSYISEYTLRYYHGIVDDYFWLHISIPVMALDINFVPIYKENKLHSMFHLVDVQM